MLKGEGNFFHQNKSRCSNVAHCIAAWTKTTGGKKRQGQGGACHDIVT